MQENKIQGDSLLAEAYMKLRPFSFSNKVMLSSHPEITNELLCKMPSDEMPVPQMQEMQFFKQGNSGQNFLGQITLREQQVNMKSMFAS